ncbi:hypothetical protein FA15DRAFT_241515 [Coprinopsis marcescibilis]|uniref:Uncharacterized protein n=1 Tax=Coprinopsis marcescibilis TaxID=230819 RepID=A0A5C3KFR0_COPMA|nr:hypothetical protein FA15DRAFT_241515 [Coprinopsis marcescibilis]
MNGAFGTIQASVKELTRRARSESALDKASGPSFKSGPSTPRLSIPSLPKSLPSFRRSDGWRRPPTHDKSPLVTMTFSSQSFLDSVVTDENTKHRVYSMKTTGATTSITRSISAETQFSTIRWPKHLPTIVRGKMASDGVSIHLGNARWIGGENFLKRGPRMESVRHTCRLETLLIYIYSSSRKFTLPNYSQPLKWKRYGNIYWCTTLAVKGPVAILEPGKDKVPTRIHIYETLHDKYDANGVLSYQGVYVPLLDYILVTSLLLVTDLQEWMLVKKSEGKNAIVPPRRSGIEAELVETTTTEEQWRKILYREPLYGRLGESSSNLSPSDSDSQLYPITPITPLSSHFVYRKSSAASVPAIASLRSFSSNSEYQGDDEEEVTIRPLSPSMESEFYPSSSDIGHNYFDPSYNRKSVQPAPPVPPLPLVYRQSNAEIKALPSPPASPNTPSRPLRKLPMPPSRPGHLTFASGSGERAQPQPEQSNKVTSTSTSTSTGNQNRSNVVNRTRSMTARAAPRPLPAIPAHINFNGLRRSRSHATLNATVLDDAAFVPAPFPSAPLTSSRALPPTPHSTDPTSPPPHLVQGELRAAAATARAIRQQGSLFYDLPPPPDTAKDEDDELVQWVQLLTSPGLDTQNLPPMPLPRQMFDMPPPAYNSIAFLQAAVPSHG